MGRAKCGDDDNGNRILQLQHSGRRKSGKLVKKNSTKTGETYVIYLLRGHFNFNIE